MFLITLLVCSIFLFNVYGQLYFGAFPTENFDNETHGGASMMILRVVQSNLDITIYEKDSVGALCYTNYIPCEFQEKNPSFNVSFSNKAPPLNDPTIDCFSYKTDSSNFLMEKELISEYEKIPNSKYLLICRKNLTKSDIFFQPQFSPSLTRSGSKFFEWQDTLFSIETGFSSYVMMAIQADQDSYKVTNKELICDFHFKVQKKRPLEFSSNFENITFQENKNYSLECTGNVENICWFKDGNIINQTERIQISNFGNTSHLVISNVNPDDSGNYTCLAMGHQSPNRPRISQNIQVDESTSHTTERENITNFPDWVTFEFIGENLDVNLTAQPKSEGDINKENSSYRNIIISFGLLAIILTSGVPVLIVLKKRKKKQKQLRDNILFQFKSGALSMIDPKIPIQKQAEYLPYHARWEFPKNKLQLVDQLGSGTFGLVFKGLAKGIVKKNVETVVAVKTIKNSVDSSQIKALASELKIMIHLGRHLNVLNLLGACTKNIKNMELYIIVEFCHFGDLREYLVSHKDTFFNLLDVNGRIIQKNQELLFKFNQTNNQNQRILYEDGETFNNSMDDNERIIKDNQELNKTNTKVSYDDTNNPEIMKNKISTKDLVCWSFQISRGMDFLNSRRIIHGDLAARNILLAENNVVKISDFGLAKNICDSNYVINMTNNLLPLKWMSIESIRDHKFSFKSDVWSFGVVLWEIFTLGQTPYPGIKASLEFINLLKEGYRMEKPEFCPKLIYDLMLNCWQTEPNQRPSFADLENKIGSILEEAYREYYVDLNMPYMQFNLDCQAQGEEDHLSKFSSDPIYINRPVINNCSN